jgi:dienelactone hydrolase
VHSTLCHWLDRLALRSACASVRNGPAVFPHLAEARSLLGHPDFFGDDLVSAKAGIVLNHRLRFAFSSQVPTPWTENNLAQGRLYGTGLDWRTRPAVILLHGWNGEAGYYFQFPYLAWRLRRRGLNVLTLELPYHARRRPSQPGAVKNFLSPDLLRTVEAVRQAVSDIRALVRWLHDEGLPGIGLWGVSLGAWLAGLTACAEPRLAWAVLMTPVARMDRGIAELPFCAGLRQSLKGADLDLRTLNLISHTPRLPKEQILILESRYDLFAPAETVEELWQRWNEPEIWRFQHGHISVLLSLPILERMVNWVGRAARRGVPIQANREMGSKGEVDL